MQKRVNVEATIIAQVWVHEDEQGNQTIIRFEEIKDTLKF